MIKNTLEDLKLIANNLAMLFNITSVLYLAPIIVALIYKEPYLNVYLYIILGLFHIILGKILSFKVKKQGSYIRAIITVGLFWILFNMVAALPFVAIEGYMFIDSLFEVVSATTTTGLTIMGTQNLLSFSTLFWRSFLGWIGGLGIIALALLGVFFNYSKIKDFALAEGRADTLRSSIKNTISSFWTIYIILTLIGILIIVLSGVPLFDAINYAFTAISTTGTDIFDGTILDYSNLTIILVTLGLMIAGATSFVTHYLAIYKRKFSAYVKDREFSFLIIAIILTTAFILIRFPKFIPIEVLYATASSITGGGLSLIEPLGMSLWPEIGKIILIILMIIGGSTASTAGGIKIQRVILLVKMFIWKIKSLSLPKTAYFPRKFAGVKVERDLLRNVMWFSIAYVSFLFISTIIFSAFGYSAIDSLFEIASAQGNVGISIGIIDVAMPFFLKLVLIFNMLIGRLEIIPIFAIIGFIINLAFHNDEEE